jgi:hypothetical protein
VAAGAGLDKIRGVVLELPRLMSRAATDAVDLLEDVITEQFANGTDPYGEKWAAKADGSPSHLEDSGALSAFDIRALPGSGIVVSFGEDYAQYHQSGTSKMAQRRLVPDEGDFNRSLWYAPIVEAYSNAILKDAGWRAAGADSVSKD